MAGGIRSGREGFWTIRLLSYKPDTVEQELTSARDLLTGNFRDSYTQLTNDAVIPGAKEKKIAARARWRMCLPWRRSGHPSEAVALVFVNQIVTVGNDAPTSTNSSVKVTLDKRAGDRWLISSSTWSDLSPKRTFGADVRVGHRHHFVDLDGAVGGRW